MSYDDSPDPHAPRPAPTPMPDPAVVTSMLADLLGVTSAPFTADYPAAYITTALHSRTEGVPPLTAPRGRDLPSLRVVAGRLIDGLREQGELPPEDVDAPLVADVVAARVDVVLAALAAGRLDAHLDRLGVAVEARRDAAYLETLGVSPHEPEQVPGG